MKKYKDIIFIILFTIILVFIWYQNQYYITYFISYPLSLLGIDIYTTSVFGGPSSHGDCASDLQEMKEKGYLPMINGQCPEGYSGGCPACKGLCQCWPLTPRQQEKLEEEHNKRLADTIGGKTPQETWNSFISAMEAGDYDTASKYFVYDRQEEEMRALQKSSRNVVEKVVEFLKTTDFSKGEYVSKGAFWINDEHHLPVIQFNLYPSGNWKIADIYDLFGRLKFEDSKLYREQLQGR